MTEEIVAKLIEYLEATKDFTFEQAPQIFNEILAYSLLSSLFICAVCLTILYIGCKYSKQGLQTLAYEHDYPLEVPYTIAAIMGFIAMIASIVELVSNFLLILQILVAPKMFLFEFLLGRK